MNSEEVCFESYLQLTSYYEYREVVYDIKTKKFGLFIKENLICFGDSFPINCKNCKRRLICSVEEEFL